MTDKFEVWTSPHNQVLQLMAETGAVGAVLVLAGVGGWCWQAWRRHCAALQPATWWVVAAVGVEMIHSLLEFPLWSAHFLGVTALLMGTMAGVSGRISVNNESTVDDSGEESCFVSLSGFWTVAQLRRSKIQRVEASKRASPGGSGSSGLGKEIGEQGALLRRVVSAATCAGLAFMLALGLRDYWRLDLTRATGAGSTLAGTAATQDAQTLRELGHGLLAPMAEFWLCVGAPLNRDELALKLRWSGRVMHYLPSNAIVGRRAIFLALDGREDEAGRLVDRLAHPSSEARQKSMLLLQLTHSADNAVIARLIARIGLGAQLLDRPE